MNIRETKKRILSLLLALALCAGTWAGDFQTVMATENTAATQEEQNSTGSDADSSTTNSTDIGSNGDTTSGTNSSTDSDIDSSSGAENIINGTAITKTEESGTETIIVTGDNGTGNNGIGTDTGTQAVSGSGDNIDDDDAGEEETTLTDEDIEKNSIAIYDALYGEIEGNFNEECGKLYNSIASEYGLNDEDNGEITDELYAQFYAKFYESACTLLDKVVTEKLNTASEQEAYADLQNEAVYKKVYDSIHDKLYEEYVAGLKEMGITTTDDALDSSPQELTGEALKSEVEVTSLTVDNKTVDAGKPDIIDLSGYKVNDKPEFSVGMNFALLWGAGEEGTDNYKDIQERKIKCGDYYIIEVPKGLLVKSLPGSGNLTFTLDKEYIVATAKLVNENGLDIDAGSNARYIKITFTDAVEYSNDNEDLYDVSYGLQMIMTLDADNLPNDGNDNISWEPIEGDTFNIKLPQALPEGPDALVKKGEYDSRTNQITWTITVGQESTSGIKLDGYTLEDTMDMAYQTFKSAKFESKDITESTEEGTLSLTAADSSSSNEKIYKYTLPTGATTPATLTIVTEVTDDLTKALLAKPADGSSGIDVVNKVNLNDSDGNLLQDTEGTVHFNYKKPITKEGKQISADLIEWTLKINPEGANIYGATVTDELASYLKIKGDIKIGGTSYSTDGNVTEGSEIEGITCSYNSNSDNTLKIKFADGSGALAGKSYTVTFYTAIDLGQDYNDAIKEIKNDAEIVCRFPNMSEGTYRSSDYGDGRVGVSANQNMIIKSASKVDLKTGNITWTIKPSTAQGSFGTAVITDVIPDTTSEGSNKQTYVDDSVKVVYTDTNAAVDSGKYDVKFKNSTLTITLYGKDTSNSGKDNGLEPEELNTVEITYQTHADDLGTFVNSYGVAQNQTYKNTAELRVDGAAAAVSDTATTYVIDSMLSKNASTYYKESDDSDWRGYKYTLTVNNNKMVVNKAGAEKESLIELRDYLNNLALTYYDKNGNLIDDTSLARKAKLQLDISKLAITIEDAEYHSSAYTGNEAAKYYSYSGADAENGTLGTLTTTGDFSGEVAQGKKATIELYVQITNADELFNQGIIVKAKNSAELSVTTDERTTVFKADATGSTSANSTSSDKMITKTSSGGVTDNHDGTFSSEWKVVINPWSAKLGDVTITDMIPAENLESVAFDADSVTLQYATHDTSGEISPGDTVPTSAYTKTIAEDTDGNLVLTVTIPDCADAYYLTYRTDFFSNIAGNSYKNDATLKFNKDEYTASATVSLANASWATGTMRDSVTVIKQDADAIGSNKVIEGATFALYKNGIKLREQTTKSDGKATFRSLSFNTEYEIRETAPAPGYEKNSTSWSFKTGSTKSDEDRIRLAQEHTFENTRTTGTVSFTKVDNNDPTKGLGGAKFLLYYTEDGVTKLVRTQSSGSNTDGSYKFLEFVNAASGDNALATDAENAGGVLVSAGSGTVGNIEVTGLPWGEGTYSFIETEGPNGYKADSTKHYEFTMRRPSSADKPDPEYGANFAVTDAKGNIISDITEDISKDARYVIFNSKYKFKLIKQDESGNPIAGVEFGLYSDEACTKPVPLKENPFSTDENGTVLIDDSAIELSSADNPTCYYLKEISAPADYKVSPDVVQFYIDSTTKKVVVLNKNKIKDYDISKAENENTFTLKDGVIQGSIALYKTDDKGKGIQGVKFNLYKLADTAVTKASGSASYSLSGKLAALMYSSEAKLIVNNLTTDADGYWYSRECTKTYTDFAGSERTVSDGLTGGWYCFFETEAVGNVIKSDEAYLFCIGEDADGNITITDAEGNSLLKGAIDINADGRYDIINTRITAYLRKEGVDKAGTSTELLTDPGKQLTLTLYEKQNGEWIKITDFKPGNVPVTDKSLAPYDGYSNDISQYLKTGKEYKIVETKPHSSLTYMKADDYYFKVDASGDLYPMTLQENGSFKVESKLEPAVIVMQDVEATMAIWNHYTHAGIFVCNLVDSRGRKIVADQTLTSYNENSAHDITVDGIDSTPGGSTASLYMLQRGVEYTLTSTYYLTKDDYQNNRNGYTTTTVVTCDEYGQLVLADGRELTDNTFHIYGATQIVVRKVAADGVLEGYEIPGASLTLLQGGIQAPAVEYNGSAVEWS